MAGRKKSQVGEILNTLAAREEEFLRREFLAPALRGGQVRVRIGGAVCKIAIEPADFEGWGVFQPQSHTRARLVRAASLAERREYLELFPVFRQIVCRRAGDVWYGSAASRGDGRMPMEGIAPLRLVEEAQLFDCACTRYDGAQFWFEDIDMRRDPGAAAYLRAALTDQTPPDELHRPGLTAEERAAYELNYWEQQPRDDDAADVNSQRNPPHRRRSRRGERPQESDPVRRRLHESLSHAGAQLVDYLERGDSYRVRYSVGGRQYTSSVAKGDLSVQVAGICLAGEDRKFDLASMVGVLREGENGGDIFRIGDEGMDEETYWEVHPPRE